MKVRLDDLFGHVELVDLPPVYCMDTTGTTVVEFPTLRIDRRPGRAHAEVLPSPVRMVIPPARRTWRDRLLQWWSR